jgi:hypothetical protein
MSRDSPATPLSFSIGGGMMTEQRDGYLREEKMEKSRERNREHAKRTRLRKKVAIESMKDRLIELQNEVSPSYIIYNNIT